jgi:hypothetical protein
MDCRVKPGNGKKERRAALSDLHRPAATSSTKPPLFSV